MEDFNPLCEGVSVVLCASVLHVDMVSGLKEKLALRVWDVRML